MLTYRGYDSFIKTQSESDNSKIDHFKATSYILHQGNKLVNRFNAFSYWHLTKTLDSHNISRGRTDDVPATLHQLRQPTLIIAINSDILCPLPEMQTLADHIPDNEFHIIGPPFGHDGFLVEATTISQKLNHWLCKK